MDRAQFLREHDPIFPERLRESDRYVEEAQRFLIAKTGDAVFKCPLRIRATEEERLSCIDDGDLVWVHEATPRRVEITKWSTPFTGRTDYPFYAVLVNDTYKVDHCDPFPFMWLSIERDRRACVVVRGTTREHWFVRDIFDTKRTMWRKVYFCPLMHATFHRYDPPPPVDWPDDAVATALADIGRRVQRGAE